MPNTQLTPSDVDTAIQALKLAKARTITLTANDSYGQTLAKRSCSQAFPQGFNYPLTIGPNSVIFPCARDSKETSNNKTVYIGDVLSVIYSEAFQKIHGNELKNKMLIIPMAQCGPIFSKWRKAHFVTLVITPKKKMFVLDPKKSIVPYLDPMKKIKGAKLPSYQGIISYQRQKVSDNYRCGSFCIDLVYKLLNEDSIRTNLSTANKAGTKKAIKRVTRTIDITRAHKKRLQAKISAAKNYSTTSSATEEEIDDWDVVANNDQPAKDAASDIIQNLRAQENHNLDQAINKVVRIKSRLESIRSNAKGSNDIDTLNTIIDCNSETMLASKNTGRWINMDTIINELDSAKNTISSEKDSTKIKTIVNTALKTACSDLEEIGDYAHKRASKKTASKSLSTWLSHHINAFKNFVYRITKTKIPLNLKLGNVKNLLNVHSTLFKKAHPIDNNSEQSYHQSRNSRS